MTDIRLSIDLCDGTLTRAEYYKWRARQGVAPVPHRQAASLYSIPGECPWTGMAPEPDPFVEQNRAGAGRTCGRIATYRAGCRCPQCRDAARRYQNEWRARARAKSIASSSRGFCP